MGVRRTEKLCGHAQELPFHRDDTLYRRRTMQFGQGTEKRGGKRVSAYGSATYIMDTDKFFENMDIIIENGAINRTFLREMSESEEATKIIHSKHWGSAIKRYFEITSENERYTVEDIKEIDVAIASVEKSRKERE